MTRRNFFLTAVAPAAAFSQQSQPVTARQIVDRIKQHIGVPWREQTVDTFKAGDPDTPVTGLATTMMATYDVLQRAAASGHNFVITHEPTFYSHLDGTGAFEQAHDPVWAAKEKFISDHHMVVWRFHDHWHLRRPDGILQGMAHALGWQDGQNAQIPALFTVPKTTVEQLASGIKSRLHIRVLRVVGRRDLEVTHVALSPGAGGPAGHLNLLRRDDVDVLVVGEVPEWETIEYVSDAAAEGRHKALILMGHIPSEQAGMENCAEWLKTFIKDVPIAFVAAAEPFWMPR